jgi:protein transport protein SEC24
MEQQFYYQQNAHNNHLPQDVSQQQQYYQLNGSVSQTHQSLPSNQMPNQSYFGNQSIGGSVPPQQHYGQQMASATRPPPQKSSTQFNANYPQMSATLPPQQQSLQSQRTPQQLSATQSQQPVSQQMNVLSEQMSNISFSGSQQRPHIQSPPHSANGPQPTQQSINTLGSIPPYSVAPPQPRPVVTPQTNVMPAQRAPQPPMDSIGHQNWSNPSFSALPGGQSTPIPDKWNSGAIQSNISTAPPVMPPMSPQFGPSQQQPQQANRYMPSYPPQRPLQATQQMPQMPPQMSGQMPSHGPPMTATQQRYGPQTTPNQLPQPNYGLGSNQLNAQQTQQRLDPEAMPSVVQVIEEDKSKYDNNDNVLFTTSIPASVPPLVTTIAQNEYSVTNDGGCARPNHLRSTLYQVPVSEDTLKTTNIPLAIVVQPFDDSEVEGKIVCF